MSDFVEYLEARSADDTKVRAVLRRSLAFAPGAHVPAYPFVEPFVSGKKNGTRRDVYYLVAGLWAAHFKPGQPAKRIPIGRAAREYMLAKKSESTERRFITLLDADRDQLPYRLRQMVALLKDAPLDFGDLLRGLLQWNSEEKYTQRQWARDFYRENENAALASANTTNGDTA